MTNTDLTYFGAQSSRVQVQGGRKVWKTAEWVQSTSCWRWRAKGPGQPNVGTKYMGVEGGKEVPFYFLVTCQAENRVGVQFQRPSHRPKSPICAGGGFTAYIF